MEAALVTRIRSELRRRPRRAPLPGAVNFAFGRDVLFITSDTAVWAARGA
jgi:hypothetical protein